ncbi:hypothetical protein F4553_006995 [Allocatelliglobosispora scoriae]|uniref:Sulfotransferase family protein n=1 Tax=Allocatelliglobosispora scoriae TaxID=643052 RepID=A0A841C407_9ACTN|nr:hypothetical protein [Allocatelliglobosispora scoriae]MBB5873561.1 hypothetical protein [Allocatelliglobosispora scoriae]
MAQRLALVDKTKPYPLAVASPTDFRWSGEIEVDPQLVVTDPGYSLYCLDHDNRRALFTRTGTDLSRVPFLFQTQYADATDLVALSYAELHALRTPAEPSGVFLYSTGRCGSTLVAAALAECGGLTGLSEPDVLTQLVMLGRRIGEPELRELARSCVRVLARGRPVVIKPRSFVVELGSLLHDEFPHFASVFLYREPQAWGESAARAFDGYDPALVSDPGGVQDRLGVLMPLLAERRRRLRRLLTAEEVLASMWVSHVEHAMALRHRGVDLFTTSYEEIAADPQVVLSALFQHCGLPAPADLDEILARDSQSGTPLSRAATWSDGRTPRFDETALARAVADLWIETLRVETPRFATLR